MNVAFDSWIPIINTSGCKELASLCAVLTEGDKFVDLAVRPHERVALMRLFLCVTHAALKGPKNYNEWREVPKKLPEAALTYLNKWKDSFELFHETKPWLQVAGLSKSAECKVSQADTEDWTPVSKLNFSFATGNNTTLFDHSGMSENRSIVIVETLLSMLTFQCFSPGGLISQVYWNGKQSGKSSKDGPCVPASMIHAFLRGKNLLATIHLNLPTHEDIQFSYGKRDFGKPVWEMMPTSFGDLDNVKNATETYVGRLVSMTRLIHLHPSGDRMLIGDGLPYPTFTDGFPQEPTATVVVRQKGGKDKRAILSYQPAKALWRELAAIVIKRKAEGTDGPLSLRAIQDGKRCDLIVAALARDKATIVDTAESVFHISSQLHSNHGTVAYESEVKTAEAMANRLGYGIETYRREIDHGWEGAGPAKWELKTKLHALATIHYWTTIEKNLPLLMAHIEAIGTDNAIPTRKAWRKMLFSAACEAYRIVCGQETPRQLRAFAKGLQKLTTKQGKSESATNKTKEKNHEQPFNKIA
ncbi:MAG: type I-E CRISPR-associated protein Cse1/CasA [Elusimicrobia bacterium]|nr:type I-E CRISPR-associated protein Cse1/CasA [Elusimicrobiota bacterium]